MALYIRFLQECYGYETDITLRATAGHFSPAAHAVAAAATGLPRIEEAIVAHHSPTKASHR